MFDDLAHIVHPDDEPWPLEDDDVDAAWPDPIGTCDTGRYELIVMWDDLTSTESELVASALGALVGRRVPGAVSTYIDHMQ